MKAQGGTFQLQKKIRAECPQAVCQKVSPIKLNYIMPNNWQRALSFSKNDRNSESIY